MLKVSSFEFYILLNLFLLQRRTNIVMFILYYPSARDVDYIQSLDRLLGTSAAGLIFAWLCLSGCHNATLESYIFALNTAQLGESAYLLDC